MSNTTKISHSELEIVQRALMEARASYSRQVVEYQTAAEEAELSRKKIEQAHREWMSALDVVADPIFLHDKDFRILRCNKAYRERAGIPFKQIVGQPYYEVFPKTHAPLPNCLRVLEKTMEDEILVSGTTYRSRAYSITDQQGAYLYSVHVLENINDRLETSRVLRESEMEHRCLFEAARDGLLVLDAETGKILDANPSFLKLLFNNLSECIGKRLWEIDLFVGKETGKTVFREMQTKGFFHRENLMLKTMDGRTINVEFIGNVYEVGERKVIQCNIRDITERKRTEENLNIFRALLDNSSDAIEVLDPVTLRFLDVNETECRELGYTREELLSMHIFDIDAKFDEKSGKSIGEQIEKVGKMRFESVHRRKDGSTFPVEVSIKSIKLDRPYLLSIARNTSERKQAEESLNRKNRAFRLLGMCNTVLVRAKDEQTFLSEICRLAVEAGGYLLAWVGFAEDDAAKTIRSVAQAGDKGYLDRTKVTWADTELGRGPTGTAIRTGLTVINQDYITNPQMAPWREAALAQGYHASIALPLNSKKRVLGALTIYAKDASAFGEEEVAMLEKLANDVSHGIETLRARIEHEQHTIVLQQSLEQSIRVIASTVAVRDPYTAEHQQRVSMLAQAITKKMGLPEEQVHGIHLAATIHDLGKIQIPSEILSKSGKLNDVEYMLIQAHPQAGYDILKEVKFPWPIADVILQHHERLDGSGYPRGLKDNDILLEAKVLAVADVVEAMLSHRPYRTGLGLDFTLQEIERNRGKLYDPMVADACLKLFREDGYTLPGR